MTQIVLHELTIKNKQFSTRQHDFVSAIKCIEYAVISLSGRHLLEISSQKKHPSSNLI